MTRWSQNTVVIRQTGKVFSVERKPEGINLVLLKGRQAFHWTALDTIVKDAVIVRKETAR